MRTYLYFYYCHTNHYYYFRGMRPLLWLRRWFWLPARAVPLVGWLEEDRGRVRAVHVDRLRKRFVKSRDPQTFCLKPRRRKRVV